jgi:KUP system potassium uptake protein
MSAHGPKGKTSALVLGALGIVFGDIGTSPLYALKECVTLPHGLDPKDSANILGLLSLMFWSLTLVVAVKYLTYIMRADNRGEGGILALLALVPEKLRKTSSGGVTWISLLVLVGAALLYGDGIITPAISVLSAVEGLEVATTSLKPYVVPITCVILAGLFGIQRYGTEGIGRFFGPVMVLWFGALAVLGVLQIVKNPSVFAAVNPHYAIQMFQQHHMHGFWVLGSVVLCVTGGEALYADMGHFGVRAIRIGWFALAMPALLLNYFGQGAMLLAHPETAESPFFSMAPEGGVRLALVMLATAATVIASQALISGAFSLTHQAIQLGFFPRVTVKHTSKDAEGQIFIPEINFALGVACIALVLALQKSERLAAAYGIAVTGTMGITSIVYFVVARYNWKWGFAKCASLLALFLAFDIPFFVANAKKFFEGGYIPIVVAIVLLAMMLIWNRGRQLLGAYIRNASPPLETFIAQIETHAAIRIAGTGVYMCSQLDGVPPVLGHHTTRLGVIHNRVILLTIKFEHDSFIDDEARATVTDLGKGFHRVIARYGFMETPDVPAILDKVLGNRESSFNVADEGDRKVIYFLGRETFLATAKGKMGPLTESIFGFLSRNSRTATSYFRIPPEQVIEIGYQIDL